MGRRSGFTLLEVVLGGLVLSVSIAAILGAYIGQLTLNEHARNVALGTNDANRVIEQIRQQNSPCPAASNLLPWVAWPAGSASWDDWLSNAGGGKSILPTPVNNELVAVTCQAVGGGGAVACNNTGANDPVRVTVAVCWRHRGRIIGECNNVTPLTVANPDGDGITESPVMLTTLVTCR